MTEFRRLISYIYEYEGKVKGRNVGFAKLETRNGLCRLNVSVKKLYLGSGNLGVYLLSARQEIFLGNMFLRNGGGEFRTVVQASDVEQSGETMDDCYGLTIHEKKDSWKVYTTIWEDTAAQAAELAPEAVRESPVWGSSSKNILNNSKDADGKSRVTSPTAVLEKVNENNWRTGTQTLTDDGRKKEYIQGNNRRADEEGRSKEKQNREEWDKEEKGKEAENNEKAKPEEIKDGQKIGETRKEEEENWEDKNGRGKYREEKDRDKTDRDGADKDRRDGDEKGRGRTDRDGADKDRRDGDEKGRGRTDRDGADRSRTGREEKYREETDRDERTEEEQDKRGNNKEEKEQEIYARGEEGTGKDGGRKILEIKEEKMGAAGNQGGLKGKTAENMIEQQEAEEESSKRHQVMERRAAENKPPQQVNNRMARNRMNNHAMTPRRSQGQMFFNLRQQQSMPAARPISSASQTQPFGTSKDREESVPLTQQFGPAIHSAVPEMYDQQPASPVHRAAMGGNQQSVFSQNEQEKQNEQIKQNEQEKQMMERHPGGWEEQKPVIQQYEEEPLIVGDPEALAKLDEEEKKPPIPLWDFLSKTYPKIQAFESQYGCEILVIKPQDIGLLPREVWVYGNNSFLLHGYYNYRYLILARLENPNGSPRYLLGVPGHYYNNEKYMASMFGFPNFVLSKKQQAQDGRFGYWYTDVRLAQ